MTTEPVLISDYYRFYEDNNRNGLKYDIAVDNAIIGLLNNKNEINRSKLKSQVESSIQRKLSPSTFQSHLNILVNHKILNRRDEGRGKEVLYSLTEGAERLLKLNLLRQTSREEILCRKIFEKLFFYLLHHSPARTISSEEEFDKFLKSEVNLSSKDLKWGRVSTGSNHEVVDIIYGNGISRDGSSVGGILSSKMNTRKEQSRLLQKIEDYWKARRGHSKVLESIEFICIPISSNLDFLVTKTEHWEIRRPSKTRKYTLDTYLITLPGVSISELMMDNNICTICKDFDGQAMVSMNLLMKGNSNTNLLGTSMQFDRSDVEKAFVLLMQNGLIKTVPHFHGNELRYVFADGRLRDFIDALRNIHEREFGLLFHKWALFEEPSKDEENRITRLLGKKEAKRIFRDAELSRFQHRKKMRKCDGVEEYNQYLKEVISGNDDPDWRRYSVDSHMDASLSNFKETRRNRTPITKKELKKDVLKYDQYLREKLKADLEDLYHDPYSEGVDFIWLIHGLTIQKYEFLQDIIKEICPKIIEVYEDKERLSKINNDRLAIFPGWKGKQPRLSDSPSIYVHDQASLISASIIDDPATRGRLRRNIPDITNFLFPDHNKKKESRMCLKKVHR